MKANQREAYLNVYKGSLLEFLVAGEFARRFGIYSDFIRSLSSDLLNQLKAYELAIRNSDKKLLDALGKFSKSIADHILLELQLGKLNKVILTAHEKNHSEADFLLVTETKTLPISLKLCKKSSFVNTKSAGARSFFSNYFKNEESQSRFNQLIDLEFEKFARKMHEEYDLKYNQGFKNWPLDLEELPGQLVGRSREIYLSYLHKIGTHLYNEFSLLKTDYDSLIGFGSEDILQVICLHKGTETYEFEDLYIHKREKQKWVLEDLNTHSASFHLHSKKRTLQIRCKPMNKFTVPSFKINCAVKYF